MLNQYWFRKWYFAIKQEAINTAVAETEIYQKNKVSAVAVDALATQGARAPTAMVYVLSMPGKWDLVFFVERSQLPAPSQCWNKIQIDFYGF